MKHLLTALVALALTGGSAYLSEADAKRLGGGRSSGMQRDMPARTAPDAPPGKPAGPAQQQQAQQGAAATGAAAAATPKRNWLGPLAGLAAGLGLAALLSHLGLGAEFAQFLLLALIVLAAVFAVRWFLRRNTPQPAAMARTSAGGGAQVAWPAGGSGATPAAPAASAVTPAATAAIEPAAAAAPAAKAFVPAAFDAEGFGRTAKLIFIRMQAANDAGDAEDLRSFTTPELFAELSLDLQERRHAKQHTEVLSVDATVLDVTNEPTRQVVSVRFRGELREEAGAAPVQVDEVWHLVKPHDDSRSWAIAGIEQMA